MSDGRQNQMKWKHTHTEYVRGKKTYNNNKKLNGNMNIVHSAARAFATDTRCNATQLRHYIAVIAVVFFPSLSPSSLNLLSAFGSQISSKMHEKNTFTK